MHSTSFFENTGIKLTGYADPRSGDSMGRILPRKTILGVILVVALLAFELFNFDTTRYALQYMLGDVSFWGVGWATILAVAFCAIDFAGLARLFTPERGTAEPKAVWYLMGAWLLGATMNAAMTWWAVSLTLLSHDFGNEVLGRDQLLRIVPMFVAALVWLIRVLFIGALSVAGEHLFEMEETHSGEDIRLHAGQVEEPRPAALISVGKQREQVGNSQTLQRRRPAPARPSWSGRPPNGPRPPRPVGERPATPGMQAQRDRR